MSKDTPLSNTMLPKPKMPVPKEQDIPVSEPKRATHPWQMRLLRRRSGSASNQLMSWMRLKHR